LASLVLNGNTSGSVTISSPAVSGTTTLTLPAANGTIITTGSPQSGGVIQVVNSVSTAVDTTSNTGFVTTSLSLSITPKFSNSKILLTSSATVGMASANVGKFAFARNGTLINNGSATWGASYLISAASFSLSGYPWSEVYLDSPATTSATTYAVYFGVDSGGPVSFNSRSGASNAGSATLIAMEIAA
jgi:hypothetical protein